MNKLLLWVWPLAMMAPSVNAQTAGPAVRADPLDAKAATAPLVYRSLLSSYRRFDAESPPQPWREANQTVERIGGWRTYAREAAAPEPAASTPAPAPAPRSTRPATPPPGHRH